MVAMHRKQAGLMLAGIIGTLILSGCGGGSQASQPASALPDGDCSGRTEAEKDGSYGIVKFSVADGSVSKASFVIYDADGTPHDETYGQGGNQEFFQRAQNAVAAEKQYVSEFVESGDQTQVESQAGASLSYRLFRAAIDNAIENAS